MHGFSWSHFFCKCIEFDQTKTDVVKSWPRPICSSNIRSFFGFAGYYRRFVEGCSWVASPLITFTKKKLSSYGPKYERRNSKSWRYTYFRSGVDFTKRIRWVCCLLWFLKDKLGCVLMKNRKFVDFVSRKLNVHENNYPIYEFWTTRGCVFLNDLEALPTWYSFWCHYHQ